MPDKKKKSDMLKKAMSGSYFNGGKKTFTRPEGWEKTLKRSHFDKDKAYSGESYESIKKKKDEESGSKKRSVMLKALSNFFGGDKK